MKKQSKIIWQIKFYDCYYNELYSNLTSPLTFRSEKQAFYYIHTHPQLFPEYKSFTVYKSKKEALDGTKNRTDCKI